MKTTQYYSLKKPDPSDFVRVGDINENTDAIDAIFHEHAEEIDPATAKDTPVDADSIVLTDSADGRKKKRLTWVRMKETLKGLFYTKTESDTKMSQLETPVGAQAKADAAEQRAKSASRPVTWTPTAADVGAAAASHTHASGQVGLGNVPNVATNDQTPTYAMSGTLVALVSGEKLSVALGKLAKALTVLISHIANKSNPHGVTAAQAGARPTTWTPTAADVGAAAASHTHASGQVGLGNVPNVATNDQTPTYSTYGTLTALTSGEKLSVAFGKLARALTNLISHIANKSNPHAVTAAQAGARPSTWTPTAGEVKTTAGTTVEAELINRANNSYGVLTQKNLLSWAIAQTQSGPFVIDPSTTTDGVPINNLWFTGQLDVGIVHGSWSLMLKAEGAIYTNSTAAGIWGNWESYYANAPQAEFDLPLVAGLSSYYYKCAYYQDRNAVTTVTFGVTSESAQRLGSMVVAWLPVGFRPQNRDVVATASFQCGDGSFAAGSTEVKMTGEVRANVFGNIAADIVIGEISFVSETNTQRSLLTAKAGRSATPQESTTKCMCVVDAAGNFVEFVQVTITYDEKGVLHTVYCYEMQDGERLIDTAFPSMRPYAGALGFVHARWNGSAWTEAATEEEIAAWEMEHPVPQLPRVPEQPEVTV